RAAVGADELPEMLDELLRGEHVSEVLVLSTCNRVEIYAEVDRFHGGLQDASAVLANRVDLDLPSLGEHLYVHYEDAAVLHLFSVAAGLDSMVVGESQILGQLRAAYVAAAELDAVNRELHELCQHALRVGKRVHSETGIDRAGASVVSVGLSEAERLLGPLPGKQALVIGAGSMGALSVATLARAGVGEIVVANRSPRRAERLAAQVGAPARAVPLDAVPVELAAADLVVGCTGAVGTVLAATTVEEALPAGRWCCSTWRCRGTSTGPPASCRACTTSTWPRCSSRRSGSARTGTWSGPGRSSARRSPAGSAPAGPPRSPRR